MKVTPLDLSEVLFIEPLVFEDERGSFCETFSVQRYRQYGVDCEFVQDNFSFSRSGTLRGLHFQVVFEQAKLVSVLRGRIFDVAVDIRRGSPSFGKVVACELDASRMSQVFIPEGFAHGFFALEDAHVFYKCSASYSPPHDRGIAWDDPALGIAWPDKPIFVSDKDRKHPRLGEISAEALPHGRRASS